MAHKHPPDQRSNDQTRDTPDEFDKDLERDNQRRTQESGMSDFAEPRVDAGSGVTQPAVHGGEEHRQHARQGQAQSPRELNLNQPEKKKEGHHPGARQGGDNK